MGKTKKVIRPAKKVSGAAVDAVDPQFKTAKGPQRSYISRKESGSVVSMTSAEKLHLGALLAAALAVRLYQINTPASVVFDEQLVGNAINYYNSKEFFVASEPPDGFLLYSWLAKIFGYAYSSFMFHIGAQYIDEKTGAELFPYTALRSFSALCGAALVLFVYRTARASGVRHTVALFGSFLLTIENSLTTQSQYFFLETPMLFFLAFAVAMYKTGQNYSLLSTKWIFSVALAGLALGYTVSTKLAGVFLFVWFVLVTVKEFWFVLGDLKVSDFTAAKFLGFSVTSYLAVPVAVYFFFFSLHISSLPDIGPGYSLIGPDYQASLNGNHLQGLVSQVSLGAEVMLRQRYSSKYLDSTEATYANGHQQVSLVANYKDLNNIFYIEGENKKLDGEYRSSLTDIKKGSKVQLYHNKTESLLRADPDVKPQLSEQDYNREVSTRGNSTWEGDEYTKWEIKIVPEYCRTEESKEILKAVDSVFQIYNPRRNCYLLGTRKQLPKEAGSGGELICIENARAVRSLWYIDYNNHPLYTSENAKVEFKELTVFDKFVEINKIMWRSLKDNTFTHRYSAKAKEWPLAKKGIPYFVGKGSEVYFVGNLIVYYLVTFCVVLYILWQVIFVITWNPFAEATGEFKNHVFDYQYHGFDFVLGWLVNILPYHYFGDRTFFTFMYLPSLYFGLLLICQTFEFIVSKRADVGYGFMLVWGLAALLTFIKFAPLIYGTPWDKESCEALHIQPSWDNFCGGFRTPKN